MRERILLSISILAALGAAGCQVQPTEAAATGSPPAVEVPVGPIPGPGKEPRLQENPFSNDNVALTEGRKLFVNYNCYGCHGGHGGGGMGPSLRDATWIYGSSDAHVFSSIAEGRGKGMPAWGSKIPQDQIWKLVAYVKSLNTPSEPDPPVQR
jgi:cytochrome c oxidase cbb3-type subunit 3